VIDTSFSIKLSYLSGKRRNGGTMNFSAYKQTNDIVEGIKSEDAIPD
jgi:hypothetical protein